jgi:hypothetical protein
MDIVPIGPIPGRTPIRVPNTVPKKQNNRLIGWSAIVKP